MPASAVQCRVTGSMNPAAARSAQSLAIDTVATRSATTTAKMTRPRARNGSSLGDPLDEIEPPGPPGEIDRPRGARFYIPRDALRLTCVRLQIFECYLKVTVFFHFQRQQVGPIPRNKFHMREYPVSRAFVDARIQTIYGGTTEIMKTIVAKDLGL